MVIPPVVKELKIEQSSVIGGTAQIYGEVILTGPAPSVISGWRVPLSSSQSSVASVPAEAVFPDGFTSTRFVIFHNAVAATTTVVIGAASLRVNLTVLEAALTSLSCSPDAIRSNGSTTCTIKLTGPALTGGVGVTMASSNANAAPVPAQVRVPTASDTATFTLSANTVTADTPVTITASYKSVSKSATLRILPATSTPELEGITLETSELPSGHPVNGQVSLTLPATTNTTVTLSSTNSALVKPPATVVVTTGSRTASFQITTASVPAAFDATIEGRLNTVLRSAKLRIVPPSANALKLSATSLVGGTSGTLTVSLNSSAPSVQGGFPVRVATTPVGIVTVPDAMFAAGATSATVTFTTKAVTTNTEVTFSSGSGATAITTKLMVTNAAAQGFELEVAYGPYAVKQGETVKIPGILISKNGFNADVELSAYNLPGEALAGTGFLPKVVRPTASGAAVTFTLVTNGQYNIGSYNLKFRAVSGALNDEASAFVQILPGSAKCVAPTIKEQPASATVKPGVSVTLNALGSGDPVLSYQWHLGYSGDTSRPIANATGATLTTGALFLTTRFWVRVTNLCGTANSNTAVVTVINPSALKIEALDPNCSRQTQCKGEFLREVPGQGVMVVQDPDILASEVKEIRSGASADGLTKLLLRVRSEQPVTFSVPDQINLGKLTKWNGSTPAASVTVDPVVTKQGKFVFAVYIVPGDFPGASPWERIEVTIKASSSIGNGETTLSLHPSPVVLIHGLWSDGDAWKSLQYELKSFGYGDALLGDENLVEYKDENASSFDPQLESKPIERLISTTQAALTRARARGLAVSQVSVVAHSLGGLLTRARTVYSQGKPYRRMDNYLAGDFARLITVGTPHHGSALAAWLIAHKCDRLIAAPSPLSIPNLEALLALLKKPLGDAVYGLQPDSKTLKNIGSTSIPTHAIVGIAPSISLTKAGLNQIFTFTGNLTTTIDDLLGRNDTIVAESSQGGGLQDSSRLRTVVNDVVHTDETSSTRVWQEVKRLLISPMRGSFDTLPAHNSSGNAPTRTACSMALQEEVSNNAEASSPQASVSLTPTKGTAAAPGDTVQINFIVTDGKPVKGAFLIIGEQLHLIEGIAPFNFSFTVPNKAGRLDITALTFGGAENYAATTYVNVKPASLPQTIRAIPQRVILPRIGQRLPIQVAGLYADGKQIDLTSASSGTTYGMKSGNSRVASVSADGLVEMKGEGQDAVVISAQGKTITVPVYTGVDTAPDANIAAVNAASFSTQGLAPEAIGAIFGIELSPSTKLATLPLPLALEGMSVTVIDSTNTQRDCPLFYISPGQINFQLPAGTAQGVATIIVNRANGLSAMTTVDVEAISPGVFTLAGNGLGTPAANILRIKADNTAIYENVTSSPIDFGASTDRLFLALYGTGIRNVSSLSGISCRINGLAADVTYAGRQSDLVDQINVALPRALIGKGVVEVALTLDGKPINTVKIAMK